MLVIKKSYMVLFLLSILLLTSCNSSKNSVTPNPTKKPTEKPSVLKPNSFQTTHNCRINEYKIKPYVGNSFLENSEITHNLSNKSILQWIYNNNVSRFEGKALGIYGVSKELLEK